MQLLMMPSTTTTTTTSRSNSSDECQLDMLSAALQYPALMASSTLLPMHLQRFQSPSIPPPQPTFPSFTLQLHQHHQLVSAPGVNVSLSPWDSILAPSTPAFPNFHDNAYTGLDSFFDTTTTTNPPASSHLKLPVSLATPTAFSTSVATAPATPLPFFSTSLGPSPTPTLAAFDPTFAVPTTPSLAPPPSIPNGLPTPPHIGIPDPTPTPPLFALPTSHPPPPPSLGFDLAAAAIASTLAPLPPSQPLALIDAAFRDMARCFPPPTPPSLPDPLPPRTPWHFPIPPPSDMFEALDLAKPEPVEPHRVTPPSTPRTRTATPTKPGPLHRVRRRPIVSSPSPSPTPSLASADIADSCSPPPTTAAVSPTPCCADLNCPLTTQPRGFYEVRIEPRRGGILRLRETRVPGVAVDPAVFRDSCGDDAGPMVRFEAPRPDPKRIVFTFLGPRRRRRREEKRRAREMGGEGL
ncbi:hypothetical protein HDU96_003883 [Phlyctochytrium bullatum]|nr:hypothetical protein HDU96_003883 [Phlyctochytrium bullatum]